MATPSVPPPDRYGRRPAMSPRHRAVLAALGVGVLVALTVAMFVWTRVAGSKVDWTVIGYDVPSDSQLVVDFVVTKPDGTAVTCRVVGKDRSMAVVGSLDVDLPAAGSAARSSVRVPTRGRAVVGTVDSCAPRSG